jgi:hypothetical protein
VDVNLQRRHWAGRSWSWSTRRPSRCIAGSG